MLQRKFTANWTRKMPVSTPCPCRAFRRARATDMPIRIYRTVQTNGNTQSGGVRGGLWRNGYQLRRESLCSIPAVMPTPTQNAGQRKKFKYFMYNTFHLIVKIPEKMPRYDVGERNNNHRRCSQIFASISVHQKAVGGKSPDIIRGHNASGLYAAGVKESRSVVVVSAATKRKAYNARNSPKNRMRQGETALLLSMTKPNGSRCLIRHREPL